MNNDHITKIFVVDDDEFFGNVVKNQLEDIEDMEVHLFTNAEDLIINLYRNPDIVVIDYDLPDKNGLIVLDEVKNFNHDISSIILSGQKKLEVVVEAYRRKADRYIIKDQNALIELKQNITHFQKVVQIRKELASLQNKLIERNQYNTIIGKSPAMEEMFDLMHRVENINIPVLITGSNGTGKELVANALHFNSSRKRRSFVAINVAAIPEDLIESELFGSEKGAFTGATRRTGKFEEANGGTIFLDEIGEMPLGLQAKLLRVLQENKIVRLGGNKEIDLNIKILSATNKDLWEEVKKGRFREDLYFRLQGFIIEIPSLKDRGNDIIQLAKHFAKSFCKNQRIDDKTFSSDAFQAMLEYSWPGNVRELKSMIERAILIGNSDTIQSDDLVFLNRCA